jgi:hypothetical protein
MNNIVDLQNEREINALIDKLGSLMTNDQTMTERTKSVLNGNLEMKSKEETVLLTVRVPKTLFDWIDSYSRITAVNKSTRITRTMVVVSFLEQTKALMEHQEKTVWGMSHQDKIKEVLEMMKQQQPTGDNNEG